MYETIREYTDDYIEVLKKIDKQQLIHLYNKIENKKNNNNTVFVMGNGGSAASSSHWVCDFNKGTNYRESKRVKMISLADNVPIFSALGNDLAYEDVFIEQLKNYLDPNDLVLGLSVSGNSENLVRALEYANSQSADTFSIVGSYDSKMERISNDSIVVPSRNYGIVEDIHMYICHVISQYMYKNNKQKLENSL